MDQTFQKIEKMLLVRQLFQLVCLLIHLFYHFYFTNIFVDFIFWFYIFE